mgnify:CR=1 FL=1|jgi:CRISPR/Cas system-associated exonuclease Cas4 (RecB family)
MMGVASVVVLILVALLLAWVARPQDTQRPLPSPVRSPNLPDELIDAHVVYTEKEFKTQVPRKLLARVDQVYETPDRRLIPVEGKKAKSARVYRSHRIQLSVQALVLRHAPDAARGREVASWGYVKFFKHKNDLNPTFKRVELMDEASVVALNDAYRALLAGTRQPKAAPSRNKCAGCAWKEECPDAWKAANPHPS